MILGIAGTIGAGKGAVVDYLKEKKGFSHYSSSGILKGILQERGVSEIRENLSKLAEELVSKHEGGILQISHKYAVESGVQNYILEAIHREKEADYIRSLGGLVLGVDADIRTRYERISKRGEGKKDDVTFEQFVTDSKREDEGKGEGTPNINSVIKNADFVIKNNGTLEELHKQVDEFLERYGDK